MVAFGVFVKRNWGKRREKMKIVRTKEIEVGGRATIMWSHSLNFVWCVAPKK